MARPVTICRAVTTKQSGPTIPRRRLTSLGGSPLGRHCRPSLLNRRIALSSSLGVHADHRIGGVLMGSGLLADVPGTARPGRRAASHRPGVALQDESLRPQQVTPRCQPSSDDPGQSAQQPAYGSTWSSIAAAASRRRALPAPPEPAARAQPWDPGQPRTYGRLAGGPGRAAQPRRPAHRLPATTWPRGPRRPRPPGGSRHAPVPRA